MGHVLLRPRWLVGHVVVLAAVVLFVNLGFWQLRRLDERREFNALVADRVAAAPVALDEALAELDGDPAAVAFTPVTVTGRYGDDQVLTAPRSQAGRPGPNVLTVLEADDGPDVLVNRGWIPMAREQVAPPPQGGRVQVSGVLRAPEAGDLGEADQVVRIAPEPIGERLDRSLPPVWLQLTEQSPATGAAAPTPVPLPERTEGNHLSYALQWFSFAAIALIGYPIIVRRVLGERRAGPGAGGGGDGGAGGSDGPGGRGDDGRGGLEPDRAPDGPQPVGSGAPVH